MTEEEKKAFDERCKKYFEWRDSRPYDPDLLDEMDTGEISDEEFKKETNRRTEAK